MLRNMKILTFISFLFLTACGGSSSGSSSTIENVSYTQISGAVKGITLSLTGAVTTIAGTADIAGSTDGTGSDARFTSPFGITTDGNCLYVADTSNSTIRKVEIATGVVTTLAGQKGSYGSTDGTGSTASFKRPVGITTDGANLYVTDEQASVVRKIVIATGAVTTLAGKADVTGHTNGTGTDARFYSPKGIAMDGTNLFVADANTIRKIVIATGAVTTLAGMVNIQGTTDGTGTAARFSKPFGITTDGTNLFVAEYMNQMIRKIQIATGQVTTIAGTAWAPGSTDGTGTAASFYYPHSLTMDDNYLYVADTYNHTIRKIEIATGAVTTLAGSAGYLGSIDSTLYSGNMARFRYPTSITTDGKSLFVTDAGNCTIRRIN